MRKTVLLVAACGGTTRRFYATNAVVPVPVPLTVAA
jgi:hypothetical protein